MNNEAKSLIDILKIKGDNSYQITDNMITDNSYHVITLEILEKYISRFFGVFVFSQVREKIKTVFFLGAIFVINNIKINRKEREDSEEKNPSTGLFLKNTCYHVICYQLSVIMLSVICYQLSVITPQSEVQI